MAAKDLGTKFTCFKCGAKFYDLRRPEPVCPKCGADQRESPALKPADKSERKRAAKVAVPEPEVEQEALEDEDEDLGADEDLDEAPEDDDDL